jgi:hypothetical protein
MPNGSVRAQTATDEAIITAASGKRVIAGPTGQPVIGRATLKGFGCTGSEKIWHGLDPDLECAGSAGTRTIFSDNVIVEFAKNVRHDAISYQETAWLME